MRIFGLRGFTHDWARIITVMSPDGARALAERLGEPPGLEAVVEPGALLHYRERRAGGIDALVARHGIEVLDRAAWKARKATLGRRIFD